MDNPADEDIELILHFKQKLRQEMYGGGGDSKKGDSGRANLEVRPRNEVKGFGGIKTLLRDIKNRNRRESRILKKAKQGDKSFGKNGDIESGCSNFFSNTLDAKIYNDLKRNFNKCNKSNSLGMLQSRCNLDNFMERVVKDEFLQRRRRRGFLNDEEKRNSHIVCEQRRKIAIDSALLALSDFFDFNVVPNKKRTIFMALSKILELNYEIFELKRKLNGEKD